MYLFNVIRNDKLSMYTFAVVNPFESSFPFKILGLSRPLRTFGPRILAFVWFLDLRRRLRNRFATMNAYYTNDVNILEVDDGDYVVWYLVNREGKILGITPVCSRHFAAADLDDGGEWKCVFWGIPALGRRANQKIVGFIVYAVQWWCTVRKRVILSIWLSY